MRTLVLGLVAGLVLAAGAAGGTQKLWPGHYGFLEGSGPDPLVRIDRESLRPVGAGLSVGAFGHAWSFSPDRSRLALAWSYTPTVGHPAAVRIVDLHRWRSERLIQLPGRLGQALALTWSGGRLLVLAHGQTGVDALAFDVDSGKPVFSRRVSGNLMRAQASRSGFVALEGQANSIGGAQLLLVDTALVLTTIPLDRITAGSYWDAKRQTGLHRVPGLVIHPDGSKAYVLSADESPAAIDLRARTVTYGNGRALARVAKRIDGPLRFGLWAGANRVVYGGVDLSGEHKVTKIGVSIVDIRTWQRRMVDDEASAAAVGGGLVLTWDAWPGVERSPGIRAYATDGALRWTALPGSSIGAVQVAGTRGLVRLSGTAAKVLDLRTGEVVRTISGDVPDLLLGNASSW